MRCAALRCAALRCAAWHGMRWKEDDDREEKICENRGSGMRKVCEREKGVWSEDRPASGEWKHGWKRARHSIRQRDTHGAGERSNDLCALSVIPFTEQGLYRAAADRLTVRAAHWGSLSQSTGLTRSVFQNQNQNQNLSESEVEFSDWCWSTNRFMFQNQN